jgi:hypothetical protein
MLSWEKEHFNMQPICMTVFDVGVDFFLMNDCAVMAWKGFAPSEG